MTPSGRTDARVFSNRTERTAARQRSATGTRIQAYQGNRTAGMEGGLVSVVVGGLVPAPVPLLPFPDTGGFEAGGIGGF
jgi:hypothetical protein